MPRWLSEDPSFVYSALGGLALLVIVLGWMNRDRAIPIGSAKDPRKVPRAVGVLPLSVLIVVLLALLAAGVRLIDYLIVTDREQIEQAVREMAGGVKTRDLERIFRNVSDTYQGPPGSDKKGVREYVRRHLEQGEVTSIEVWDFSFPEEVSPAQGTAKVQFYAKPRGRLMGARDDLYYLVEATFHYDADKRWRLQQFTVRNPAAPSEILPLPH
jgi:hypothetical protein